MLLHDIRTTFLDFFKNKDHTLVESSPLVPRNDPTLMFTAAGMVQFKDVFTGLEKRGYTRAASSQKCLRAGGKHNDLDNVGYTTRHHTFFEMLGNFSFGDYFKEEAISFAWDLITKEFGLSKDRLLVTVYHEDTEAANIWKKLTGFSDHKIIRIATADNFWSMGDTGPCGPCTEIFYDHGEGIFGGPPGSKDEDGDRFTEIWNLVFMQYEKLANGTQINLPKPSVDTGMGLERVGAVLQGVHSNFDTDLFRVLIAASKDLTGNGEMQQSHQVIADHLRACGFLIADGVLPSNEGRGYVLRRIMRRAMRHVHLLGAKDPLMHQLVPTLLELMGGHYGELKRAQSLMISTLKQEEEKFHETLERGLGLLNEETTHLTKGSILSGDVAFKLYDTYGFPVDLTADVLRTRGITLDEDGFTHAMNMQKEAARASWAGSGESKHDTIWFDVKDKVGVCEFLGYTTLCGEGIVTALVQQGKIHTSTDTLIPNDPFYIVCNQTPFYGESGGQMGDRGILSSIHPDSKNESTATVMDTLKPLEGIILHKISMYSGNIRVGDALNLSVDEKRRRGLAQHHSVTHLLHAALRQILGEHVTQKGSLVEEDRLRFDFTHMGGVSEDEIKTIELLVNKAIQDNTSVDTHLHTPEEASAKGAMALFGEKYGDVVRVVSMGDFSMELCGGTHVNATGDIGLFKIVGESGIASGIRRMEAVAGQSAIVHTQMCEGLLKNVALSLKATPQTIFEKVDRLLLENKKLMSQLRDLKQNKSQSGKEEKTQDIRDIGELKLLVKCVEGYSVKDAKGLMDTLKKTHRGLIFLSSVEGDKVTLILGTSKGELLESEVPNTESVSGDLLHKDKLLDAAALIREISPLVGGQGGGGRPDLAQAGGNNPGGIQDAIARLMDVLE